MDGFCRYLYEHQDAEIYQKDIEKYFGICRSGVTNIIQALEKKGLVCRASVASDARLKKVMLTEAGREKSRKSLERFSSEWTQNWKKELPKKNYRYF